MDDVIPVRYFKIDGVERMMTIHSRLRARMS